MWPSGHTGVCEGGLFQSKPFSVARHNKIVKQKNCKINRKSCVIFVSNLFALNLIFCKATGEQMFGSVQQTNAQNKVFSFLRCLMELLIIETQCQASSDQTQWSTFEAVDDCLLQKNREFSNSALTLSTASSLNGPKTLAS